ncbi:MAG TPA: SMI1/KNR4 family protein [Kofleriaceae bacterium]
MEIATGWPPLDSVGPSIDQEQLTELEAHIGAVLPEAYAAFLLAMNGGGAPASHCVFDVQLAGQPGSRVLSNFLSAFDPDDDSDLVEQWDRSRAWLPGELMPIAADDRNGQLLLGVTGARRGELWFLDDAFEVGEGADLFLPWYERSDVCLVAPSFEAFIALLRPLEPAEFGN